MLRLTAVLGLFAAIVWSCLLFGIGLDDLTDDHTRPGVVFSVVVLTILILAGFSALARLLRVRGHAPALVTAQHGGRPRWPTVHRASMTWVSHVPSRVRPHAVAWHRRGVAASFKLHDRVLSNRRSRQLFVADPPALSEAQRDVVQRLDASGFAVVEFADLADLVSAEAWQALERQAAVFVAETEADLDRLRQRKGKNFLVRRYDYGRENTLAPGDPWLDVCLSPTILGIANAYLRLLSKLEYVDLWYSIPVGRDAERRASQAWHRDFEDSHLLKVFLYLHDVDEHSGPFEFVAGSQIGGPFGHIDPWQPTGVSVSEKGGQVHDLEREIASRVPPEQVQTFTGAKGTLIFCDTTGLHRGGFAEDRPRVLATAAYTSPASLAALTRRNFSVAATPDPATLDAAARYAIG